MRQIQGKKERGRPGIGQKNNIWTSVARVYLTTRIQKERDKISLFLSAIESKKVLDIYDFVTPFHFVFCFVHVYAVQGSGCSWTPDVVVQRMNISLILLLISQHTQRGPPDTGKRKSPRNAQRSPLFPGRSISLYPPTSWPHSLF